MSTPLPQKSVGHRTWIAVRFALFGCVGLYIMLFGLVAFVARVFDDDQHVITWCFSLPLAFVGAFMILYGVAVFLALARVRAFYARRAKDQTQIQSDDHDAVS